MQSACIGIVLLEAIVALNRAPVILENTHVRLELDPRTFSVRFLGFPGGQNFVEPVHLSRSQIAGDGWHEPGGITTDLLPDTGTDAPVPRGSATVVEKRDDYVLILGPEHPDYHWRLKKEYQLAPDAAEVRYKLTALSSRKEQRRAGARITAQIPPGSQLAIPRDGTLGLVHGIYPDLPAILAGDGDNYNISASGPDRGPPVLLSAPVSSVTLVTATGRWTRDLAVPNAATGTGGGNRHRLLAMLDGRTHTYQVALEVFQTGINVGAPLVVVEIWTLAAPGAAEGPP